MGLVDKIKSDVKKSGTNKGKFLYFKEGTKVRVRFLSDMDDGLEVKFHDSFAAGINVPCQEIFGRNCSHCDDEELRTRSQYIWSVWDYEAKEVKLIMAPVNNCSPIPAIVALYDTYGTLLDRDYVITKTGKGQSTAYTVIPMDKVRFRNEKAKPFAEKTVLKMLDKAYPDDDSSDDDDEDEKPKPRSKKKPASVAAKDDDEVDYESMTARELYDLCVERDIDVQKRKDADYYIERLKDSEEPEDDDSWPDEEDKVDYSEMTAKDLYNMCEERKVDCVPRKPESYYIKLLKEKDKAEEDWSDEEDGWGAEDDGDDNMPF